MFIVIVLPGIGGFCVQSESRKNTLFWRVWWWPEFAVRFVFAWRERLGVFTCGWPGRTSPRWEGCTVWWYFSKGVISGIRRRTGSVGGSTSSTSARTTGNERRSEKISDRVVNTKNNIGSIKEGPPKECLEEKWGEETLHERRVLIKKWLVLIA